MLQTYQVEIQGTQLHWLQAPPKKTNTSRISGVVILDARRPSRAPARSERVTAKSAVARRCIGAFVSHQSSATLLDDMASLRNEWDAREV
jgi:hypothetical protein